MSDTKHTPLPWVIREEVNGYAYIGHAHPESPSVAMIPHDSPEDRANVALILTAVNAHADLLAALDDLARSADTAELLMREYWPGETASLAQRVTAAIAAIDKAKGGAA